MFLFLLLTACAKSLEASPRLVGACEGCEEVFEYGVRELKAVDRHGYLRGWIKTGWDGKYRFYTQIPRSYPNGSEPAHIHPYILEPDGKYYWLVSIYFEGEPLLAKSRVPKAGEWRGGGTGILKPQKGENIVSVTRDIVPGKNVPGYTGVKAKE